MPKASFEKWGPDKYLPLMDIVEIRLHINGCKKHSIRTANYSNNNKVTTTNISTVVNTFKAIV